MRATVLPDGRLELSVGMGRPFRCGPGGTAMWIALCQHDWEVEAAAVMLASLWQVDAENMRADLELWIGELWDAGLLRYEA